MLIDQPDSILRALPIIAAGFEAFSRRVESLHLSEFWPTRHILSLPLQGMRE